MNELLEKDLENVTGGADDYSNCHYSSDGSVKDFTNSSGATTIVGGCKNNNTSVCGSCCCAGGCCHGGDHYATASGAANHEPLFWITARAQ